MKPFILTSVLALATLSSLAQGTINANNSGSGINLTVSNPTINGGVPVALGKAATAAGFIGAGPAQVTLTLYGATSGTALSTLESAQNVLATGLNSPSTVVSGTEAFGNPFTLPTVAGVYDGTAQDEFIWYGSATVNGIAYGGFSVEGTGLTPATGSGTPTIIFGTGVGLISSFNVSPIPEPATIALGGLGAAALLLFRRRK